MKLSLAAAAIALAIPAAALAADGKQGPRFPMAGEAYLDMVEARLDRIEARIDKRLEKSKQSDADKEKVRKHFEDEASKVMEAAQKAAADGTVTAAEAKAVRARGHMGKAAGRDKLDFPMEGKAFVSHVEAKHKAMAAKVAERLAKAPIDDAKKAEIRARVAKRGADMVAAAKAAAADGTVTADEAKAMRQHHRDGAKGAKGPKGPKGPKGKAKGKAKGGN